MSLEERRRKILELVREFAAESLAPPDFQPGKSTVPPSPASGWRRRVSE